MRPGGLLSTIKTQANKIYQPQIKLIGERAKLLPTQYAAAEAGLAQEKTNNWRDLGVAAEGRGLFYSGYRPEKQAQYLGVNYLPKLAELNQKKIADRFALLEELNKLYAQRGKDIIGRYDTLRGRSLDTKLRKRELASAKRISEKEIAAILKAAQIG